MSKRTKTKRTETKPVTLAMPDFCNGVTRLLTRYYDAGCCPGCMAEVLFHNAVAMVAAAGGICWTKAHPEEIELIEALTQLVVRRAVEVGGAPPGATLQ